MKRLFLLLAMAGVMAACGGEDKKSEEAENKTAFDYYVDYMKAAAEDNQEAYNEAYKAYEEATKDMSREEENALFDKMNRWNTQNSEIASKAMSNHTKMNIGYEKSK